MHLAAICYKIPLLLEDFHNGFSIFNVSVMQRLQRKLTSSVMYAVSSDEIHNSQNEDVHNIKIIRT